MQPAPAALLEGFSRRSGSNADPCRAGRCSPEVGQYRIAARPCGPRRRIADSGRGILGEHRRAPTPKSAGGPGDPRARCSARTATSTGAIATTRAAITQRIALSGHDNRETALLFNSLAISLATANRLPEALKANYETTAIYRALGLGDGLDAQIIVANTGTLELRDGHLEKPKCS